jgi:hypothetical protein
VATALAASKPLHAVLGTWTRFKIREIHVSWKR